MNWRSALEGLISLLMGLFWFSLSQGESKNVIESLVQTKYSKSFFLSLKTWPQVSSWFCPSCREHRNQLISCTFFLGPSLSFCLSLDIPWEQASSLSSSSVILMKASKLFMPASSSSRCITWACSPAKCLRKCSCASSQVAFMIILHDMREMLV